MNRPLTAGRQVADAAGAIAILDCDATRRLAQKTRRAVRDEVISNQEQRIHQRQNLGWALMGLGFILLLLAPALWVGLEDILAGEHILDLPAVVTCLILMLYTTVFGVLIAFWRGQRGVEHDRGGFEIFPSLEK